MARFWKTAFFIQAVAEESLMQFEKASDLDLAHTLSNSRTSSMQKNTQEMEDQYKAILMNIAKSGSWKDPATGNPWVPDSKFLDPVKGVIQDMEDELDGQKDLNTKIMDSHTKAIQKCNDDRDALLAGRVTNFKNAMKSARTAHSSCRAKEDTVIASMEKECTSFDSIQKCEHDYLWYASLEVDDGVGGAGSLTATISQAALCRQGIASTSARAKTCDGDQDAFQAAWCTYAANLTETCDKHDACFASGTDNWDLAETTILKLEKEQKTIFRMLGRIRCYLNLLFGASDKTTPPSQDDINSCQATTVGDTALDVTYGAKAQKGVCYASDAVKDEDVKYSAPGGDEWYNKEFAGMGSHGKLQANTECSV